MMPKMPVKPSAKTLAVCGCLLVAALQLGGCGSREQRAQNYYNQGMSYIEKKDLVKAQIELRNALQIDPNFIPAWRALAQITEANRSWQALAGILRKIVELDPKDVVSKIRLGRLFLLGGSTDNALKQANDAVEQEPQNTEALSLKAAVLFKLKDTDGASKTAQKILEIDPGNMEATVVMAATKATQGDYKGALATLDTVKQANKDDTSVLFLQVSIFNKLGDLPKVEGLLRKLVELHPKEQAFRAQLVGFYVAHGRKDDAVNELRAVVAADPADVTAETNLVNLLASIKGREAAREELVKRIAAGGEVFPFQIALARADFADGKFEDSKKLLESLISNSKKPEDVITAQTTLAQVYMSRNDVAAAEPLVTAILKADSRNIGGLMLRASIHMNRGQVDDAIADLRTGLNDQPQSPELLSNLAIAYERAGSIELADKAFRDATKASNYNPNVGMNYLAFLRRRGFDTQADNMLAELASRNPTNLGVLSALAQVKLARKDWAAAHAIADSIRRLGDKTDLADQISGIAFSGEKKFESSASALQNAYDANPGAAQPMAALVDVYVQAKEPDKAEAFLQSALKANPANAEALVLLGTVHMAKKEPDKAEVDFKEAIKQQPKHIIGYRALSELYLTQKKRDEALKVVRAGLEQQPDSFYLRLNLAGLLEVGRDYEGAIAEYERMLKDQPGSMIIANNLASLLADHRTDKASMDRAGALAALLQKSTIPQFKDTLGWVAYHRDDYNAAIPLLEDARSALPENPLIRYHLGMAYLATGQNDKASEQFAKARELAPNDSDLKMKIESAVPKSRSDKTKG